MRDHSGGRSLAAPSCLFSSVLCPVELDRRSAAALYNAVALAAPNGRLDVLTVVHAPAPHGSDQATIRAAHETALQDFVWQHVPSDLPYLPSVNLEMAYGDPAQAILLAADCHEADLVVMGTRGHGRLLEALIGSVTHHVLRNAHTAVMVIPPFQTELVSLEATHPIFHLGRILVPIDPLRENMEQLRVAINLRRTSHEPLLLVCVNRRGEPEVQASQLGGLVEQYHLPADTEVLPVSADTVAAGISEAARGAKAGLIVMGLERQQKRMTPGSIAHEVIRHTESVVLATPPAGS